MGTYKKFLGMVLVTVLAAIAPIVNDGLDTAEIVNVAILAFGTMTVLGATNLPAGVWRWAKTVFAVGSAVLVVVAAALTDGGITVDEIIQMALAGAGALGIVPWVNNTGSGPGGESTAATGLPGAVPGTGGLPA